MSNPSNAMTELADFLADTRRGTRDEDRAAKAVRQAKDLPAPLTGDVTAAVAGVAKGAYPDSTKVGDAIKHQFPGLVPDARPGLQKLMRRPIGGITVDDFVLVGNALADLPPLDNPALISEGKVNLAAVAREWALAEDEESPSPRLTALFTSTGELRPEAANLTARAAWLADKLGPHRPKPPKTLRRRVGAYLASAWYSSCEAVTQGKAAFIIPLVVLVILSGVLFASARAGKTEPPANPAGRQEPSAEAPATPPPATVVDNLRQQLKSKEFVAKLQGHTVLIFPHAHAPAVEAALTEALSPTERVLPVSVTAAMFGDVVPASSRWLRPADIGQTPTCGDPPAEKKKLLVCYVETFDNHDRLVMFRFEPHQLVAVVEAPAPAKSPPPSADVFKSAADKLRAAGLGNTEPALRWLRMAEAAAVSPKERAAIAAQRALVMKENGQREEALALLLTIHQHLPDEARAWADPLLREWLKVPAPPEPKK